MQILTDSNNNIIQTASLGDIPNGIDIDLSMYKLIDGNLILDTDKVKATEMAARIVEIKSRLAEIDSESIRPLRAVLADTATDADKSKLTELENEAIELRTELSNLEE